MADRLPGEPPYETAWDAFKGLFDPDRKKKLRPAYPDGRPDKDNEKDPYRDEDDPYGADRKGW